MADRATVDRGRMFARRDLLKLFAVGSIGSLIQPRPSIAKQNASADRPRYFVFVYLQGGVDAIYTTDPKTVADVDVGVDVPYKPEAIATIGNHRVGPHLQMLGDAVKDLTIINGVHTNVLNHITGTRQFLRMKIGADGRMPTFASILSTQRDSQAVGEMFVDVAGGSNGIYAPRFLGSRGGKSYDEDREDFFELVERTSPDDRRRLARAFRGQRDLLSHADRISQEQLTTASNIEETARFFERSADVANMPNTRWEDGGQPMNPRFSNSLQRTLWLVENDLANCVFLQHQAPWDTHALNTPGQTQGATEAFPALGRFIAELHARKNRHGSLWDNTIVVASSELGRFPRLNAYEGKDHFPEMPVMLFGKSLRKETFGATGRLMEAQPVSLATGRPDPKGTKITLDDVSATLLSLAGIDPAAYGYFGRQLEFVCA